jgi:predicted glutamine amidotransferase
MCELFGMSCNKQVTISFTWRGFIKRGSEHKHGWGVAFYPDGFSACIIKEPKPSTKSPMAEFLKSSNFIKSKIVISHVRWATRGDPYYRNTHPFVRELFGRDWVFAHNGTIDGEIPNPKFYEPIGETDSERAFCLILDRLRELGRNASLNEKARVIEEEARKFSRMSTVFNFLMSNGEYLFAFRSKGGSLNYTIRIPPHNVIVQLMDEDFKVDLSQIKGKDEVATIVATKEITRGEFWVKLPENRLTIFKDGLPYLSREQWNILKYVRQSPHRVSIREISKSVGIGIDEAVEGIAYLREIGMLVQDSRDAVSPTHPDATFHTNTKIQKIIYTMLDWQG